MSDMNRRGTTVRTPPGTTYSLGSWIKGYAAWALAFPLYLFLWGFAAVFKRLPSFMLTALQEDYHRVTQGRDQDVRIPSDPDTLPYMLRWWRIKRNAFFNIYYHNIRRSDDDTALHDHPWWNFSIILHGSYFEHTINEGGVNVKTQYSAGDVRFRRSGSFAHRLELHRYGKHAPVYLRGQEAGVHTIFITGPVLRRWGFHHPLKWVDAYEWDQFLVENGIRSARMEGYAEQNERGTND